MPKSVSVAHVRNGHGNDSDVDADDEDGDLVIDELLQDEEDCLSDTATKPKSKFSVPESPVKDENEKKVYDQYYD